MVISRVRLCFIGTMWLYHWKYNTFIFNELDHVNSLRNRIAHHEPICFPTGHATITTSYIQFIYNKIITLFDWLGIDTPNYLWGIDHVNRICNRINSFTPLCSR